MSMVAAVCAVGITAVGGAGLALGLFSGTAEQIENGFGIVAGADHANGEDHGKSGDVEEEDWNKYIGKADPDGDGKPIDRDGDGIPDKPNGDDEMKQDGSKGSDGIPDKVEFLQAGEVVPKDPRISSNVDYDAWCIVKVEVPTISAIIDGKKGNDGVTASLSGSKEGVFDMMTFQLGGKDYDLAKLKAGKAAEGAKIGNDFVLLKSEVSKTAGTDSVYYFGYNKVLNRKTSPDHRTSKLFETFTIQNFSQVSEGKTDSININAKLTQAANGSGRFTLDQAFSNLGSGWADETVGGTSRP